MPVNREANFKLVRVSLIYPIANLHAPHAGAFWMRQYQITGETMDKKATNEAAEHGLSDAEIDAVCEAVAGALGDAIDLIHKLDGLYVSEDAGRVAEIAHAAVMALPSRTLNTKHAAQPSTDLRAVGELGPLDEIECDLPYLFGRASKEGHEVGQQLAKEVRAKLKAACAAPSPEAQPIADMSVPTESVAIDCPGCDGKGGYATFETWVDPVILPECSGETCEECSGRGKIIVSKAGMAELDRAAAVSGQRASIPAADLHAAIIALRAKAPNYQTRAHGNAYSDGFFDARQAAAELAAASAAPCERNAVLEQALELLEQAAFYVGSDAISPSLDDEIAAFCSAYPASAATVKTVTAASTVKSAPGKAVPEVGLADSDAAFKGSFDKPTDLSKRLREYAATGKAHSPKLLAQAADEIERYYGGMLAWKKSAETKDRDLSKERLARQNERIAARATQAATVTGDDPIGDLQAEARQAKLDDFVHAASTVTAYPPEAVERLLTAVKVYAHNYMQDEAEPEADSDDLVCSQKQHVEAVEVFAAIKAMAPGAKP